MKTTKTNTTYQFDFTPVTESMLVHYNSGITLSDAVTRVWNAAPAAERQIKPFRDQFTAWAKKAKYGDTHIKRVLASFDFLQLRKRSGKKGKKGKANPDKVRSIDSFVSEIKGRKFSKTDLVKLIAALAAL